MLPIIFVYFEREPAATLVFTDVASSDTYPPDEPPLFGRMLCGLTAGAFPPFMALNIAKPIISRVGILIPPPIAALLPTLPDFFPEYPF